MLLAQLNKQPPAEFALHYQQAARHKAISANADHTRYRVQQPIANRAVELGVFWLHLVP